PSLGTQDRLLGAHALLWATPLTAALGTWERKALTALDQAGAPMRRAVVLADAHLLARLSDDPEREGAEVHERVAALLPGGWDLQEEIDVVAWLRAAEDERDALAAQRRAAVSRLLLTDALGGLEDQVQRATA